MKTLRDFLQTAKEKVRLSQEPDIDTKDIEAIRDADWETVLERFTEDMDPWAIDIVKLADRYKSYIERLERFDLEVPGRIIVVGAVLLRMKAEILRESYEDGDPAAVDREESLEELEHEMEEIIDEEAEEGLDPVDDDQLRIPEAVPKPPVKKKGKRKVTLDELKDALEKAVEIDEKREERQEERKEAEDYGIEVEEDDITNRLDQLYTTLRDRIGGNDDDAVTFSELVEEQEKQEKLDKFVHVMHLETDQKVRCMQEEWLGDLHIEVLETENN
jgi:segregation and condensation protein A